MSDNCLERTTITVSPMTAFRSKPNYSNVTKQALGLKSLTFPQKSELLNIKRGTLMWGSPNGASDIGLIENVSP